MGEPVWSRLTWTLGAVVHVHAYVDADVGVRRCLLIFVVGRIRGFFLSRQPDLPLQPTVRLRQGPVLREVRRPP